MLITEYNKLHVYIKRHFRALIPYMTIRKACNIVLAVLAMKMRKIKCLSKPAVYRIDPSSLCNLRCVSCTTPTITTAKKRVLDADDFKIIIDKIQKKAVRASLYDMGEPLVNTAIYSMIKYAGDNNISTSISTNFNLFSEKNADDLFDSKLTVLEPCLDGYSQEKYAAYRKGGSVDAVKRGIETVMNQKRKLKSKLPIVDVQVILFDHISEEIAEIDTFLNEIKVDKITYRKETFGFNSATTTLKDNVEPSMSACFWLYIGMAVGPDGSVYPCCGHGFDEFVYGNIIKQDLSDIWNNKYYQFSRALFRNGPDLEYDDEMKSIPCLKCGFFRRRRTMKGMGSV